MNNKSRLTMDYKRMVEKTVSFVFGVAVVAVGIINMFWGNDPGFGVFILFLAFIYFPPVSAILRKMSGFSIVLIVKIILGLFIIWAALGVGELFDKIHLMMLDL